MPFGYQLNQSQFGSFAVSYQLSAISCQLTQSLFKILFPSAISRQPSAVSRQPSAVSHQLYHALWVSAFALSAFLAPFA